MANIVDRARGHVPRDFSERSVNSLQRQVARGSHAQFLIIWRLLQSGR